MHINISQRVPLHLILVPIHKGALVPSFGMQVREGHQQVDDGLEAEEQHEHRDLPAYRRVPRGTEICVFAIECTWQPKLRQVYAYKNWQDDHV